LIAGYFWLAAGGLLWILFAQFFSTGPYYDAMLHAIFLGFVFSMIFADAPIILPTITGVAYRLGMSSSCMQDCCTSRFSCASRVIFEGGFRSINGAACSTTLAVLLSLINNVRAVKIGNPTWTKVA
jgi:hypothetical protein